MQNYGRRMDSLFTENHEETLNVHDNVTISISTPTAIVIPVNRWFHFWHNQTVPVPERDNSEFNQQIRQLEFQTIDALAKLDESNAILTSYGEYTAYTVAGLTSLLTIMQAAIDHLETDSDADKYLDTLIPIIISIITITGAGAIKFFNTSKRYNDHYINIAKDSQTIINNISRGI